jgi:hypothetical protein
MRWASLVLVAIVCACGDHEPELERRGGPIPDPDVTPTPPACGTHGAGGEGGAPEVRVAFCQAEKVLHEVCQRCHQNPPLHGAPFPLVTYQDTQEPFGPGKLRWQRMEEVVESGFMPLRGLLMDPPVEPLTCEQKSTLLGWLAQCAQPEGGTDCSARDAELLTCEGAAGAPQ